MIRRPPRSTLFPYTTSSDLGPRDRAAAAPGLPPLPLRRPAQPVSRQGARRHARAAAAPQCAGVVRLLRHRSEEHTSELQSRLHLVCRLLLEKKKKVPTPTPP